MVLKRNPLKYEDVYVKSKRMVNIYRYNQKNAGVANISIFKSKY